MIEPSFKSQCHLPRTQIFLQTGGSPSLHLHLVSLVVLNTTHQVVSNAHVAPLSASPHTHTHTSLAISWRDCWPLWGVFETSPAGVKVPSRRGRWRWIIRSSRGRGAKSREEDLVVVRKLTTLLLVLVLLFVHYCCYSFFIHLHYFLLPSCVYSMWFRGHFFSLTIYTFFFHVFSYLFCNINQIIKLSPQKIKVKTVLHFLPSSFLLFPLPSLHTLFLLPSLVPLQVSSLRRSGRSREGSVLPRRRSLQSKSYKSFRNVSIIPPRIKENSSDLHSVCACVFFSRGEEAFLEKER